MITTCLNTLAKNFHTTHRNPINNNAPITSAAFIVNPSIASPHNLSGKRDDQTHRKRGTHGRDRGSSISSVCSAFPRKSKIAYSDRQKIERTREQKSDAHEKAENFRAVFDALRRSMMFGSERGERHRDQQAEQDHGRKMRHDFLPIPMS